MRKAAFVFLLVFAFPLLADDVDATSPYGQQVETVGFFKSIHGNYTIELAGGKKPDPNDTAGDVTQDPDQTTLRFPYCIEGGACFLGYVFLPHAKTQVFLATQGTTQVYTMVLTDGAAVSRYAWEVTGTSIVLRNYQFQTSPTTSIVLEHVLTKAAD